MSDVRRWTKDHVVRNGLSGSEWIPAGDVDALLAENARLREAGEGLADGLFRWGDEQHDEIDRRISAWREAVGDE